MQGKKEQLTPREQKEKNEKVQVILRVRPFDPTEETEEFISPQPVPLR
jgi:ubiquitin